MSGYLGSIGFAMPAAMGAWAAQGDHRPIIAVAGDGGLTQYLGELNTIVMYNMPIKIIVLNNSELGKISKEQRAGYFDVWKTGLTNPSFAAYAENCGAMGILCQTNEGLEDAMHMAFKHDGPALIEIITDTKLI